jgi:hypothetical protein
MDALLLEQLAHRANITLKRNRNFVSCSVYSDTPPVLAYRFRTKESAEIFAFEQQIIGRVPYRHVVDTDPTLVHEER